MYKILFFFICTMLAFLCGGMQGCRHPEPEPAPTEYGTVQDIQGNVYQTIKIGDQWWMAENLKVSRYRDSSLILKVTSDTSIWNHDTTGAYCLYSQLSNAPGFLYNWFAVNNARGLAPAGWHIPSDAEWKTLEMYLGMNQDEADKLNFRGIDEGEKMKMSGSTYWNPYGNIWSTNESGFSALAGNCRMFDGQWGTPGDFMSTGFWWSSTLNTAQDKAWYRHLDYKKPNVFRYYGPKTYGFSIRCVKD
jgi:uncharacterized protein (TIGR02145 family)